MVAFSRGNSSSATLEIVPFYEDSIEAVRDANGNGFVVVKRICENLGVAFAPQHRKLEAAHWSCITIMVTHDVSGRSQKISVLPLNSLPMWMANIHELKVAEHIRPKLRRYQLEARDALARHFGFASSSVPVMETPKDLVLAQLKVMTEMRTVQIEHEGRLAKLEDREAKSALKVLELEQDIAETRRVQVHLARNVDAALAAATGQSNWCPLTPWARREKVYLRGKKAQAEGVIIAAMCRARGIEPGRAPRGNDQHPVNSYPPEMLRLWLENYRARMLEHSPTLFVNA